jgi:hypothetical protein
MFFLEYIPCSNDLEIRGRQINWDGGNMCFSMTIIVSYEPIQGEFF